MPPPHMLPYTQHFLAASGDMHGSISGLFRTEKLAPDGPPPQQQHLQHHPQHLQRHQHFKEPQPHQKEQQSQAQQHHAQQHYHKRQLQQHHYQQQRQQQQLQHERGEEAPMMVESLLSADDVMQQVTGMAGINELIEKDGGYYGVP
jgi:hypothetical protein